MLCNQVRAETRRRPLALKESKSNHVGDGSSFELPAFPEGLIRAANVSAAETARRLGSVFTLFDGRQHGNGANRGSLVGRNDDAVPPESFGTVQSLIG